MPIQIDEITIEPEDDGEDQIHVRMTTAVELKIDGSTVDWNIEDFELDQMAFDHHVLKITLSKDIATADLVENLTTLNFFPAKMGGSLTLIFKPIETYAASIKPNEFFGVITNLRFFNDGIQSSRVTIEAKSPTWKMDQATMVKTFEKMTRAEIANQIMGNYTVEHSVSGGGGTEAKRDMTTQWMQSDWDFLITTVLGETDRWVYYDGKKLVVDAARSKDTISLELTKNVGSAEVRLNAVQTRYIENGWSEKEKQTTQSVVESSPTSFGGMANAAFRASQSLISSKSIGISDLSTETSQVRSRADAMQGNAIGNLVICYLQTNQPSIKVGNTIELTGMGPVYNGVYFVKRVTHNMDGNGYYNFVEALPLESAKPPIIESDARSWRGDPICALVIDNNDPESRGRVKVKFPFNGSDGNPCASDWIHVAGPYAGRDRGFYFLPEVDDEVLVGFFQGDIDHPVVLGSLWNGTDKPPSGAFNDKNDIKMIYTRSGHQLIFDETSGSEKISIIDKTGSNSIVIDSAQNTITVSSDKDIVFKATENVTFDVGKDFSVEAKGKVSLKATGDLSAEGMNATIKAQTAAKIEGTASLDAKGGMVNVEGSGPTTVKGNPIMLN